MKHCFPKISKTKWSVTSEFVRTTVLKLSLFEKLRHDVWKKTRAEHAKI